MTIMNKITRKQAAIIGAFTGTTCGPFEDIQEYVDSLPGFKGIMTHNFGNNETVKRIKEASRDDFIALCPDRDDP
jgi:hypothetical protein